MKKHRAPLFTAIVILLAAFAPAQDLPTGIKADTLQVGANGQFEAEPDTALVQFNIGAQEPELKDAYARAQRSAEQIRQVLRSNGIDPKEAQMSSFQVSPVYDWKTAKRKLVGYRVSSSINVKVKDFSKIGPIAEAFSQMDVTENQSINYMLDNMDAAKAKAVEDAFRKARSLAEVLAKASGRQLGTLSYASVDTSENIPIPRPMMTMKAMSAEAAPPPTAEFGAQKITVSAHVNALFRMQ